ncbi:MAG: PEP-CTERM sorting domain-containing protein [Chromatocurvus sp.]
MTIFKKTSLAASVLAASLASSGASALAFDANVTPDVIFGSGNANGGFTVDQNNGIEVGLRGKLRHNASGSPENTFNNSTIDNTYSFNAGVAPSQAFPTAEWSFEWSVNVDYLQGTDDQTEAVLADFTYLLELDQDPTVGTANFFAFDPITPSATVPFYDHAIGTNATGNGGGTKGTASNYTGLLAANNVAQNSWKPHWFIPGFDPTVGGEYEIRLSVVAAAGDAGGGQVGGGAGEPGQILAQSSIRILVNDGQNPDADVPIPGTLALLGLGLLGTAAGRRRQRRQA